MDDKIKHINPNELTSDEKIRQVVVFLLNVVEEQAGLIEQLRQTNQELKDAINRLKGEQGRPVIKARMVAKDYSSQKREKRKKNRKKGPKKNEDHH